LEEELQWKTSLVAFVRRHFARKPTNPQQVEVVEFGLMAAAASAAAGRAVRSVSQSCGTATIGLLQQL